MGGRKTIGGRSIRWDDARAAEAYHGGLWVRGTLADALRDAATQTPDRIVVIDGDVRMDCGELYRRMRHQSGKKRRAISCSA